MEFGKFFEQYIKEDAIDTLDFKGDWGDNAPRRGFDKASLGILKSPVGIEKIKRLWNKIPQTFDIYLLRSPQGWNISQERIFGEVDEDFLVDKLKINIPVNRDNITLIYMGNKGANKVPMTAWTMAHRFGHACTTDKNNKINYYYTEIVETIDKLVDDVAQLIYNRTTKKTHGYGENASDKQKIERAVMIALGTFKSARDKTLLRSGEFTFELIAQHMITGKVTLNKKLPSVLVTRFNWGRPGGPYADKRNEEFQTELDELIENAENELNYEINDLLGYAEGRIYII